MKQHTNPIHWGLDIIRQRHLLLDTVFLGVIGALSAQLFNFLLKICQSIFLKGIAGYQPPGLPNEGGVLQQAIGPHGLWLLPVVTTLGGLLSGILVYTLAPEAEGHGTDSAVKAFHQFGGAIRARVPGVKMIASAITIGSGGAAGREGPTALIAAGVGSIYSNFTHRSEEDRRLLVLIGMAAGLSAIFRSPIGTAFFAVEVLYGGMEFEPGALLYTMIGAVIAYAVNGLFVGYQPLFTISPALTAPSFFEYAWYIPLGLVAGLVATLLPNVFYSLRDAFLALRIPRVFKPAVGGLGLGLIGLFLPQLLGGGYGWVQQAINGQLAVGLLLLLALGKILAMSLTISSGGSGGVFGPSLYVGGMLGGFLAGIFHQPAAPFVVVGMAAVFGGAARVPIATLLMVTEMTGGYTLLVPAALAVMLSYMTEVALSKGIKYKSLYEAQVLGRADSPVHYAEHFQAVLRMLNRHDLHLPAGIRFNLETLLRLGIPVQLTPDTQFKLTTIQAGSSCVDQELQTCFPQDHRQEEPIAVLRGEQLLEGDTHLQLLAGDRVLMIARKGKAAPINRPGMENSRERVMSLDTKGSTIPNTGRITIDVTMNEFRYDPPTWMVFAEQSVTVHLQNSGKMPHSWTGMKSPISDPDTPINPSDILFDSGQIVAGATKTVTFTAPSAPGDYQVISTEPGHMKAGMVGQLTVR